MPVERGEPLYAQVAASLAADMHAGRLKPGDRLPPERELMARFNVSGGSIRAALAVLRSQGLTTSVAGSGVFVAENPPLVRLSQDVVTGFGFYSMLDRAGKLPGSKTVVTREPASIEIASDLDVSPGETVVKRDRIMGAEGEPPIALSTSWFPVWVVERAPNLENPQKSGLPEWLRRAFGDLYSDDEIDSRLPTEQEREVLQLSEGVTVTTLKGWTYDQESRILHHVRKVMAGGRYKVSYRYGFVPPDAAPQ